MTTSLIDAMRETLADWDTDLDTSWRQIFKGVKPAFSSVNGGLKLNVWEPIFPARKGFQQLGAARDAHIFRAFDDIEPESVRCVLLGQDPYPCMAFSTGRAFEAGGYAEWRELEKMWSASMRSLLQFICAIRGNDDEYAQGSRKWSKAIDAIESGAIDIPKPPQLAGDWVKQGVLLLNSSLTITRFAVEGHPHQLEGHIPLWRPLIVRTIQYLYEKNPRGQVFILFGDIARDAMRDAGIIDDIDDHPQIVARPHPAAGDDFLNMKNPFVECNEKLLAMNLKPITW
ncbi:MAG: uracil-DNA glycosylase [Gammaproteobacteria bacterium]